MLLRFLQLSTGFFVSDSLELLFFPFPLNLIELQIVGGAVFAGCGFAMAAKWDLGIVTPVVGFKTAKTTSKVATGC
jgi:hypothetical protein